MTAGAADAADFLYFAYGSNLSGARLRASCPSARLEGTARLAGWRLAFTRRSERWGGGVADILPAPGGEVLGAVWRIPRAERAALDRQEGVRLDPPAYRPIEVAATTPAGGALRCLAYRVAAPQPRHVPPPAAYLGAMLRGARAVGLGGAWAARIAAAARGEGAACGVDQVRSNSLRRSYRSNDAQHGPARLPPDGGKPAWMTLRPRPLVFMVSSRFERSTKI